MRKKLLILCFSIFLFISCSKSEIPAENNPYFIVFEDLYEDDKALNDDIKYISLDLSKSKSTDNSEIIELMENFCVKENLTLLQYDIKTLEDKGYIKELYFEEGIVISFEDAHVSDDKIITDASKWRSGLGAIGATFTLKKTGSKWSITNTENEWIS